MESVGLVPLPYLIIVSDSSLSIPFLWKIYVNYFIDDLLSSEVNLLNNELDLLLMQYLFNSLDLDSLKNMDSEEEISVA